MTLGRWMIALVIVYLVYWFISQKSQEAGAWYIVIILLGVAMVYRVQIARELNRIMSI